MKPAVQDAEGRVVVSCEDDQLLIGTDAHVAPHEQAVLGDLRRRNIT